MIFKRMVHYLKGKTVEAIKPENSTEVIKPENSTEASKPENSVYEIAHTTEKDKTVVYLLPSEASHTIVQIKPSLKISCIMPPRERDVTVDDNGNYKPTDEPYDCKLKTPTLMLTQILLWWKRKHDKNLSENGMCKCFSCNIEGALKRRTRGYHGSGNPYYYHWHTVDFEKCKENNLHATPYAVANTDGTYICWGRNEYPPSLRIANTIYWMSRLNNSPGKFSYSRSGSLLDANKALAARMSEYSEQFLGGDSGQKNVELRAKNHPRWDNHHEDIFGKEHIVTSQKTMGVFLSFDKGLKDSHKKAVVDNGNEVSAIIGFAHRDAANAVWIIDTNDGSICLRDDQVAVR